VSDQPEHHRHPIGDPLGQEAEALINPESPVEIPPAEQMSLIGRLRQPRTILSIAVPVAIIVIAVALNWKSMKDVPGDIAGANPWLVLAAFGMYYLGFPLRGWRWTKDPRYALCVDVLAPEGYGEIIGGSQRVSSYELLNARIEQHNLPKEAFQWYLDLRRYGSVPHSGFGMGIERAVAWICGLDHVRETIPFPRTLNRIYP